MKKKLTNKGFSLVELLAVIVILGVLGGISIAVVNVVLDKANKNYYETQEKNLLMAAKSYLQDNRNALPKNVGDTRVITLEDLQRSKYIGKVLDRNKKECTEGSITIFKYSQNDYSYKTYLKCANWETGKNGSGSDGSGSDDTDGPTISLSINSNYKNPSFTYKITASGDAKIISYSYEIYKHGVLIQDSGNIPVSKASTVNEKTISLKEFVPGEFKIVFKATDIYGTTNTVTETDTIETTDGPQCGEVSPALNTWVNTPSVTIDVSCIDKSGAGCAKQVFSQIFTTESKTNYIEISDNLGNKTTCQVDVYVDRTAPSKPVITNPYENTWINKDYSIKVSSTDVVSGIKYFEYRYPDSATPSERNWTQYESSSKEPNDSSEFTTPNFTVDRNEAIEIRACDYAGNCSESARSIIKIDKTSPTCSIAKTGTGGSGGVYTSPVSLQLNVDDAGTAKSEVSYGLSNNSTTAYNSVTTGSQGATNGITWYGFIRDAAGNTNSCNTGNFKVLLKPPVITFSLSGQTSVATCTDGNTGAYITSQNKWLTTSDLTHRMTCTNSAGQSTTSSHTYGTYWVCTRSGRSCDTCHGGNCGGCCGRGGHPCAYDCNCHDTCTGGYYAFY